MSRRQSASYETAVPGTFRLVPPTVRLVALEKDYRDMREMYFGEPKPWADIVARLRDVEERVNARGGKSPKLPRELELERCRTRHLRCRMLARSPLPEFRFSGHETFPCRYTWLSKAVRHVDEKPDLFVQEDDAMVLLGVGKNMVRSIQFWADAARVIAPRAAGGYEVTAFGRELILGSKKQPAFDPYLEDTQTLWLLHWNISTVRNRPLFGWDFLLNRWQDPYLSSSTVVKAFLNETQHRERPPSKPTLEQMFDVFVHTYLPTRGRKGEVREDNLDCPLVELQLLVPEGVRESERAGTRHEPVFKFRRDAKPEISQALFAYCLDDFWRQFHPQEKTLPLQLVLAGHGGPGQIFKLPEEDIRSRAEALATETNGFFTFDDSAATPTIVRRSPISETFPLAAVYNLKETHV